MKLRNKKTGAIYDVLIQEREVGGYCCIIVCDKKAYMQSKSKFGVTHYVLDEYRSLAEFNEEWEDYKPNEPLIKDSKIRKAVRAWAEANDYPKTMELYYNAPNFVLRSDISTIEFDKEIEPLQHGDQYSIAELCGEGEE